MEKPGDKFRQMEDEMSRFEAEISGTVMGLGTYNGFNLPGFGNIPPPPMPPMLIPTQVNSTKNSSYELYSTPVISQPAVVCAKPALYTNPKPITVAPSNLQQQQQQQQQAVDFMSLQSEVEKKLKKLKNEKVSAELAISQGKASSALQSFGPDDHKRRGKNKKLMRTAGGHTWEDHSLGDWTEDDFRIFCGDLGNDVTDELLTRTFNKYPSFLRAKVIRDKRTNKTKGYGFVSFKEPGDFTKAMKEMNGRYVGSRPIKLRKSCWKNRSIDVVRKKEKEKAALLNLLASNSGR
ncbi:PREDICTED: RNA-binding protein 42-like [Nicrophorus vespilloides]|uniref:RNA-binding protein 42 n=1 Tax=Nicrophorus vespilloides TaxID=110193 RepID=A0ABM1NI97_NICVS|nr:PREDICTED: RNA-binding protein 42-like [Nicrophorus vespilloides]